MHVLVVSMLLTVAAGAPVVPLIGAPLIHAVPAAPVVVSPPVVETRVHYENVPVVTGHATTILKPALGVPVAVAAAPAAVVEVKKADEEEKPVEVKTVPLAIAAPLPLAYAAAPVVIPAAPIPAGEAPPMDELVTKEKVMAPVRANAEITQQVTVQHPTKINIEKVAVEVPVHVPYAKAVPVPITPQIAVHSHAAPALGLVAF